MAHLQCFKQFSIKKKRNVSLYSGTSTIAQAATPKYEEGISNLYPYLFYHSLWFLKFSKVYLMITQFLFFLNCCPGSNYTTCISSQKKTCWGDSYATDQVIGYSECVKQCNQDPNCNFLFFIPDNSKDRDGCLRYDSCDRLRGATFCGSTYSKHGYCSGRICNST